MGVTFTKIVRRCAYQRSKNLTFSIPIFCVISHPSVYHFRKKSTQFWTIGCSLQLYAPNTPNLCNLGSFVSDENPQVAISNFAKKHPKRQGTYTYTMSISPHGFMLTLLNVTTRAVPDSSVFAVSINFYCQDKTWHHLYHQYSLWYFVKSKTLLPSSQLFLINNLKFEMLNVIPFHQENKLLAIEQVYVKKEYI